MNMKKKNKSQLSAVELCKERCNTLAELVNKQLFDGCRQWYWIGNEVGGVCDFEDVDVLNLEDMFCIIDKGMTYDEYAEWRNANLDDGRYINIYSWLMGIRHDMLDKEKGTK